MLVPSPTHRVHRTREVRTLVTTLLQRGPLSPQLVPSELPGAVKRVPLRALVLSGAALAVAAWGALSSPEFLAAYDSLSWLLVLTPAFLLAYYRGWRGAVRAMASGALFLLIAELVAERVLGIVVDWHLLLLVAVSILALGLGLGVLSELLQRERAWALVLAYSDPLTGLPNRRLLDLFLVKEFAAAQRGRAVSVVLFDVDGFKSYNMQYGHRVGDEALQQIAAMLDRNTRRMNLSGRYGGEEFLSVLGGEGGQGAVVFAERVRHAIAQLVLSVGSSVTVSAGVAQYDPSMRDPGDLVDAADTALRRAKGLGGNRCFLQPAPVRVAQEI